MLRKLKQKHPDLGVSDRSARRYIRDHKETVTLRQRRYYEPVESLPGVQCQVDGSELRGVLVGGAETTIHRGLCHVLLAPDVCRAVAPAH